VANHRAEDGQMSVERVLVIVILVVVLLYVVNRLL
jgi:hypothetical protein